MRAEAINDCPKTDKGTVIRAAFYKKFEALIKTVYEDAERATGGPPRGSIATAPSPGSRRPVAEILD